MQVCQPSRQPSAWVSQRVAPEGVERPLRAIRAGFLLYLSCTILSMEPAFFTTPATRGPSARVSIQPRKYTSLGGLRRSWLRALVSATLAAELMGKLEPIRGKRTLCSSTERADFAALAAVDHLLQQRSPRVHLPGWVQSCRLLCCQRAISRRRSRVGACMPGSTSPNTKSEVCKRVRPGVDSGCTTCASPAMRCIAAL